MPYIFNGTPRDDLFSTRFRESGGSSDLLVDGSSTPVSFSVSPSNLGTRVYTVSSINFIMVANSFRWDGFLGDNNPLTNGIEVELVEEGTNDRRLITLNEDLNIKKNLDFMSAAGDNFQLTKDFQGSDDVLIVNLNLWEDGSWIQIENDEELRLVVQDDLVSNRNKFFEAVAVGSISQ